MKTKIVLALVFCVAAATFFAPAAAEEEELVAQDDLSGDDVESVSRDLKEADEITETDATGTELEEDPSDHTMRNLQRYSYYPYYYKKGYYPYHGRRLQSYPYKKGYYYGKGYGYKSYYGRRLESYPYKKGYYYPSYGYKKSYYGL